MNILSETTHKQGVTQISVTSSHCHKDLDFDGKKYIESAEGGKYTTRSLIHGIGSVYACVELTTSEIM